MTLYERVEMARRGRFVLRDQFRPDGMYHIAYQTINGGWAKLGKKYVYPSKQHCKAMIDTLIEQEPDRYLKDEELI
jgi:hypothetical protein